MSKTNQVIDKSKYILSEEGLFVFLDRLFKISCVRIKRPFLNNKPIIEKWKTLKNKYQGERAFLIGNGPSLNLTPMHLLKNEYTMCFNRFNIMFERLDWLPSFYCNIDDRVLVDMVDEINQLSNIFQYIFIPDIHPYNIDFKNRIYNFENIYWLFLDKLEFSQNLPYCGINKTVASVGLQVLAYMGFNPLYLIGMDMDYKNHHSAKKNNKRNWTSTMDDDPNHFDPRYFGVGRKYHHPRLEETFKRLREGESFFDSLGVDIYNATVGGKLEIFPRKNFKALFNLGFLEEFDLFKEVIFNKTNGEINLNFEGDNFGKFVPNNHISQSNCDYFIAKSSDVFDLINKHINNYVPFGPIEDKYLFINRRLVKN